MMKRLEKKYVKAMRPNENKTVIDKTKEAVASVRVKVLKHKIRTAERTLEVGEILDDINSREEE